MSKHVLNTRLILAGRLVTEAIDAGMGTRCRSLLRWKLAVNGTPATSILRGTAPDEDMLAPEDYGVSSTAGDMIDRLYRTESPKLLRTIARSTGPDEAHDLLQDIFVRLARMGQQAAKLERPQAYLRRMAANLVKDKSRDAARRKLSLHLVADDNELAGTDQVRLLESRDMLNRIEAAMMGLRPRTREIFMAHRIDGLTYAEIAGRMGLSVKGVEKQMSKALQQIDRKLSRP